MLRLGKRLLQRQLARFWPVRVTGNAKEGFSASFPWDRAPCWASKRERAIEGCRQRGRGRI